MALRKKRFGRMGPGQRYGAERGVAPFGSRIVLERDRMVKQLQPARTSTLPASPDPLAQAGPARALAEATAPGLLFLLVVLLMSPEPSRSPGAVLSPYRVLLLALFPFLVRRWVADAGGRPAAVDLLVLGELPLDGSGARR